MTTASKTDAASDVSKADAKEAPEKSKASKKTMTQGEKLDALVKAAKANGWSLPEGVDEED